MAHPIVNVYVTETNGEEHFLVERLPRNLAIASLNEAFLDNGVVPSWVESIRFYEQGDQVTEEYHAGDIITPPRKSGRPKTRAGAYETISVEVRSDLLQKMDASGKSRRAYIEELLEN